MRIRKVLVGSTSIVAVLFAWQTIQAVGSHVPLEERVWMPPTVAAGMDDGMMLAGHGAPPAGPFDIHEKADGVTAPFRPTAATVDLSALRFFAEAGDEAAMAREIARLEATHPGFTVPDALRRPRDGAAEAALRELVDERRTEEVRARIASLRETDPGFVPSPDLMASVVAEEARAEVRVAVADGRFADAIAAAAMAPHLLTCDDPEHLWRLAEAYGGTGQPGRALAVHTYVVIHCPERTVREGSVARAVALSPAGAREVVLPAVVAAGRDEAEVAAARRAVLRAVVAAGLGGAEEAPRVGGCEAATAGPAREVAIDAATDEAAAELSGLADGADDASVLGWHAFAAGRFEDAQRWFDEALKFEERLDVVEGAILAMKARGERWEAMETARAREADDRIACLALGIAAEDLAEGRLEDPAEAERLAVRLRSADAAQVIGWHHLDAGRPGTARAWFTRSLEWRPSEPAAVGLLASADRMGDPAGARAAARQWGGDFPAVAAYGASMERRGVPVPAVHPARAVAEAPSGPPMALLPDPGAALFDEALAAYRAGDFAGAAERLEARRRLHGETRDIAMLRGWALHNAGESREAWELFSALDAQQSTRETREGTLHTWRALMPNRFH